MFEYFLVRYHIACISFCEWIGTGIVNSKHAFKHAAVFHKQQNQFFCSMMEKPSYLVDKSSVRISDPLTSE